MYNRDVNFFLAFLKPVNGYIQSPFYTHAKKEEATLCFPKSTSRLNIELEIDLIQHSNI